MILVFCVSTHCFLPLEASAQSTRIKKTKKKSKPFSIFLLQRDDTSHKQRQQK